MRLFFFLTALLLFACGNARAQQPPQPGVPVTLQNAPQRDTTNRSSKKDWHDEPVTIYSTAGFSGIRIYLPDTPVHNFQRRPFIQPYWHDLGNLGTPVRSQLFIPENIMQTGPSLGYHVYDVYRFFADSLRYYNTTRPYTSFAYKLGSKLEQTARLMHTQNISSRWNFMARYQKVNSVGYYRLQRSNHDGGALSTHYSSKDQRYDLFGAAVYNKMQTDENGGILSDSVLSIARYNDRATIPVALDNDAYNNTSSQGRRSSFTNTLRDFNVLIRQQYTLGRHDTLYNADSTQYSIQLIPRFSVQHRFEGGSQKHRFKSLAPQNGAWSSFFTTPLSTSDSVFTEQYWRWIDNRFILSGTAGRGAKAVRASAGIGTRVDAFYTDYLTGRDESSILSTYLTGDVEKEALTATAWAYAANAKLFIAGAAAGNFLLNGSLSKDFGARLGALSIGASQQLTDAPYAYTIYANQYFAQHASLSKENITTFFGTLQSARFGVSLGLRSYLIGNYVYLTDSLHDVSNGKMQLSQAGGAFTVNQVTARKAFRLGAFVLDVDGALQGITGDAPVHLPLIVGRASASYEASIFAGALKAATGVDVRYHSPYKAEGYAPFYNRFYYQDAVTSNDYPEASVFFNFKVKRFRAFLMADQVQTLFWRNTIVTPYYPSQDLMIRFGFEWVLIN